MQQNRFRADPYRPPWWLRGRHAQTILGRFLRRVPPLPLHDERVATPDGDFLDLRICGDLGPESTAPVVLVLHGLEGSSRSGYVLHMLAELRRQGMVGVSLTFRSCGAEMNRTARFYHAGETEDAARVIRLLRERAPRAPVGGVGFSLGGNVLLKLLGETGARGDRLLDAAAAVSVPYDLAAGADALERGMGRVYTSFFVRRLLKKVRDKAATVEAALGPLDLGSTRTLRHFDDRVTAPLHGFRDAGHYYAESSAARYLEAVRVPTLLIQALDDPFLPVGALPREAIRRNPHLVEAFSPRGGHVGFVAGHPWSPVFWAEREAARFLAEHLKPR